MAALKKRRAKWYARVRWYNEYGKRQEKQIPHLPPSTTTARESILGCCRWLKNFVPILPAIHK